MSLACELGRRTTARSDGLTESPRAIIAVYQLPGSNAIDTMNSAKALMEDLKNQISRKISTTRSRSTPRLAVTRRYQRDRHYALWRRSLLVILVVFIFLQGLAGDSDSAAGGAGFAGGNVRGVPACWVSRSTLCRCSVWCWPSVWSSTMRSSWSRPSSTTSRRACRRSDATLKAMEEVSGPVVAIALILAAVFVPTAFIPGITGRLNTSVRRDHRGFGHDLRVQCADPFAGAFRDAAQAEAKKHGDCSAGSSTVSIAVWPGTHGYVYLVGSEALIHKASLLDRAAARRRGFSPASLARACRRVLYQRKTRATSS